MVQILAKNAILVRKAILSDIKFVPEATTVVNNAYRSEGKSYFGFKKKKNINTCV
jgi:hypothetical protein